MDLLLTVEDAERLLDKTTFDRVSAVYGDMLSEVLALAPQPPEMGISSKDDRLRVMLESITKLPVVLLSVHANAGETQDQIAQRLAKSIGARVV